MNVIDLFLNYIVFFSVIKYGYVKVVNVLLNEFNVDLNIRYLVEVYLLYIVVEDGYKVIVEKFLVIGKVDVNVVFYGKIVF